MGLNGQVAFVTGGSRGIGRAIALALAEAGAGVAVNYLTSEDRAKEVVRAIEVLGRPAILCQGDVSESLLRFPSGNSVAPRRWLAPSSSSFRGTPATSRGRRSA